MIVNRKTQTNTRSRRSNRRNNGRNFVQATAGLNPAGQYVSDAWSLAKRTALGLNEIRKLINVEHKFIDTNASSTANQSGSVTYLVPIGQGDNISEREGDSIKVQRCSIMGTVSRGAAATSLYDTIRVLIIRDLQNAGVTPLASDVLETVGTAFAPYQSVDFISGSDLNKRFTIVYDELFVVDTDDPAVPFSFTSNHDCHTFFRGTTNTVASAGNGAYFLVAVSDATANVPSVNFSFRLLFTDN